MKHRHPIFVFTLGVVLSAILVVLLLNNYYIFIDRSHSVYIRNHMVMPPPPNYSGPWMAFGANGLRYYANYQNGELHGQSFGTDENGNISFVIYYHKGNIEGVKANFIAADPYYVLVGEYRDHKPYTGTFYEYTKSDKGNIKVLARYEKGVLIETLESVPINYIKE